MPYHQFLDALKIEGKTIEKFYPYEREFENKLDINEVWDTKGING